MNFVDSVTVLTGTPPVQTALATIGVVVVLLIVSGFALIRR